MPSRVAAQRSRPPYRRGRLPETRLGRSPARASGEAPWRPAPRRGSGPYEERAKGAICGSACRRRRAPEALSQEDAGFTRSARQVPTRKHRKPARGRRSTSSWRTSRLPLETLRGEKNSFVWLFTQALALIRNPDAMSHCRSVLPGMFVPGSTCSPVALYRRFPEGVRPCPSLRARRKLALGLPYRRQTLRSSSNKRERRRCSCTNAPYVFGTRGSRKK
jgi:hypothetical protein